MGARPAEGASLTWSHVAHIGPLDPAVTTNSGHPPLGGIPRR